MGIPKANSNENQNTRTDHCNRRNSNVTASNNRVSLANHTIIKWLKVMASMTEKRENSE